MGEKVPTAEKDLSDFKIAQEDLRRAFANVHAKSWLYQYTENLEKMVLRGEFNKARELLKKKQGMPDTLDYTKSEIQNILDAIDLYEPEQIKQQKISDHKKEIERGYSGKDGMPQTNSEEIILENRETQEEVQKPKRPRIQRSILEKSIKEETDKNAYSDNTHIADLQSGEMEYDHEKDFESRWRDEEDIEEAPFVAEEVLEARDIDRISHWQLEKKNRNKQIEEQDKNILQERITQKTMPKEKLEKKTEEASTSEQDEVISEAEQKQIKEVHDVNREMVLMELKSLGMSEEQVAFNRKSANDSALLFLRDEYRRREQKDVKNQNKRESIYQEMQSLGADEALLKKASEVATADLEEMLGALRRKKQREQNTPTTNTPVVLENKKNQTETTEAYLDKLLTPEKIEQIKAILKKGDFVLTTHGAKYTPPGGEETLVPTADLDGKISAYLLHEAGITWRETNFVAPGKRGEGNVHVDTGEGSDLITIEDGKLYIGNHYSNKRTPTSTAEIVDIMLKKCGLWETDKAEADWKKNLVSFVNGVDNMVLPGRGREYMTKTFPKTLYGSESILAAKNFNAFIQLFKDGHKGEDILPEYIQNMIVGKDKSGKEITLSQKVTRDIEGSYAGVKKAFRDMASGRIPTYSPMLGNIILNNKDSAYISRREVAKDAGLTSITVHNGKGFFISGTGKSLEKVFDEIKKSFPEAQLIRGSMILCFPEKEAFDEEKMRTALGLRYEQIALDEKLSKKEQEKIIDTNIQSVTQSLEKFKNKKDQDLTPREWNEKRALETKLEGYQFQKEDLVNPPKQKENQEKEAKDPQEKENKKQVQETNKQQELWNQAVLAQKEYAAIHEKRKTITGTPEELDAYVEAHYNAWLKTDHYIKMLRGETTEPFKPVSREEALRIVREGFNKNKTEAPSSTPEKQAQGTTPEVKKPEEKIEAQNTPTEKTSPRSILEQNNPKTNESIKTEKAKEEVTRLTGEIQKLKQQIEKGEKQSWLAKLFGGKRKLRQNKEKLSELEFLALGQDERVHPVRHLFTRGMSEEVRTRIFGNGNPTLETMSQYFSEQDETQDTLKAFNNIVEAKDNIVYFTPSGFTLRLRNKKDVTTETGIQVNDPNARYDLVDPTGKTLQNNLNISQGESLIKEASRIYRQKMQTSK